MNHLDTPSSYAGHSAYVAEVQMLVHDQVDVLFALLLRTVGRMSASGAMTLFPLVSRGDRTLSLTSGQCSVVFEVQATIDVPPGESRALLFPAGPARCIVRVPGGILTEWNLRQRHPGAELPVYAWMAAGTEAMVTESEAMLMVDHLLARCSVADRGIVPVSA